MTFGRLLTAMASPMTPDLALDLDGAQRLAVHLVEHGSDGLVVCGTTGESPTLTHAETVALFHAVAEAVGDRAVVLAGTGKNDTAATIALTREASAIPGIAGILSVTGYYNRPSQAGLDAHFRAVAGCTDLPVMLYNVPARTANEIAPETILRLAEDVPTIVAVKDTVGDMTKAAWLTARMPDGFAVYSGDDKNLLPLLAVGAVGIVSVAAHLVGEEIAELITAFPRDPARALAIHHRLLDLFTALFVDSSPGPLKAALNLLGLPGGPVRLPLADADETTTAIVRQALEGAGVKIA